MRFQSLASLLLTAALVLGAAACGESTDPREDAGDGASDSSDTGGDDEAEAGSDDGGEVTLSIESWRNDDIALWEDEVIPAFEDAHPGIKLSFDPTTANEYNSALESKLAGGTAGDIITCRPFAHSAALNDRGHLAPLDKVEGLDGFPDTALNTWSADDGTPYCVPMASVMHGFYFNSEVFDELGLEPPTTVDEFFQVLDTVEQDADVSPLAWGTADSWITTQTAYNNVGPNFWSGEEGREAIVAGTKSFTDPEFVAAWDFLNQWTPYFPQGYQSIEYTDMQQMFMTGQAAIFPGGSWEIAFFQENADFEVGAFPPPIPDGNDQCYVNELNDIAMGINADSPNQEAAATFLSWVASSDFASIYGNALAGFFPLYEGDFELENELAAEFVSWRQDCEVAAQLTLDELLEGDPTAEQAARQWTVEMWNGNVQPEEAAQNVQEAVASWYEPQQQ